MKASTLARFAFVTVTSVVSVVSVVSLVGCAGSAETDNESGDDELKKTLTNNEDISTLLQGSWTIDGDNTSTLHIPDLPYQTVAAIVLRKDGTYFAQVAPREVIDMPRFEDDSHMSELGFGLEFIGVWQGMTGQWTVRARENVRELVLSRQTPDGTSANLILSYRLSSDELSLTFPGRKTDVLHRRKGDCRVTLVQKTDSEREADNLYERILGLGQSPNFPLEFAPDLVGLEHFDPNSRCEKPFSESSLRWVWKDSKTGAIRAIGLNYSAPSSDPVATNINASQIYVYDDRQTLRMISTTTEEPRFPADPHDWQSVRIEQHRTYFDAAGKEGRTLVQRDLHQAVQSLPGMPIPLAGRRYDDLNHPLGVVDVPFCVEETPRPRAIAKDGTRPADSLAAPPVCE